MTDGELLRIVWLEPGDDRPRAVDAYIMERGTRFLKLRLHDGRLLEVAEKYLIKVEELRGDRR